MKKKGWKFKKENNWVKLYEWANWKERINLRKKWTSNNTINENWYDIWATIDILKPVKNDWQRKNEIKFVFPK